MELKGGELQGSVCVVGGEGGYNAHAYAVITLPAPRRCGPRFLFTASKQKDLSTEQTNGTHFLLSCMLFVLSLWCNV